MLILCGCSQIPVNGERGICRRQTFLQNNYIFVGFFSLCIVQSNLLETHNNLKTIISSDKWIHLRLACEAAWETFCATDAILRTQLPIHYYRCFGQTTIRKWWIFGRKRISKCGLFEQSWLRTIRMVFRRKLINGKYGKTHIKCNWNRSKCWIFHMKLA